MEVSVGVGVSAGGSGVGCGGTGMPVGDGVTVAMTTAVGVTALVGVKVGLSVLVGVGVGWERATALHPIITRVRKRYPTKIFRNIEFALFWDRAVSATIRAHTSRFTLQKALQVVGAYWP